MKIKSNKTDTNKCTNPDGLCYYFDKNDLMTKIAYCTHCQFYKINQDE